MLVRRCSIVFMEPREEVDFDLGELLNGGNGLRRERRWLALAPHRGEELEIDAAERELLGEVSPSAWTDAAELSTHPPAAAERLLREGLLISDRDAHVHWRERDEALRSTYWHPLGATLHAFTRWSEVDAVENMKVTGTETAVEMRKVLGAPPAEAARHVDSDQLQRLPRVEATGFDRMLARRVTCRNFDPARKLPYATFAHMLQRVFAAQAEVRVTEDTVFLKKNVPSGGGLHPMECYLIVQHVEDVTPGLYHYQAQEHALEPLPAPVQPLREFVMAIAAQQHWFADAHVVAVLAPRFDRTFWKYRQHAKGYRVVAMEAGHLSQTLYLSATDLGLGAFVTGAINEVQLEQAFGLDHLSQGALAICGFGWRGEEMVTAELDPAGEIWTSCT